MILIGGFLGAEGSIARMSPNQQRIAVLILHGVGRQPDDFAEPLICGLRRHLAVHLRISESRVYEHFAFVPVRWADIFEPEQEKFWLRVQDHRNLKLLALRRFVVDYVGDVIAYERRSNAACYRKVHQRLADILAQVARDEGPRTPLCIAAHSLGCVITSNFLQHLRTNPPEAATPVERGETLTSLYTLGCPLAIFGLGSGAAESREMDTEQPVTEPPVTVPSPQLRHHYPHLNTAPEWLNLFDSADVIAWPLAKRMAALCGNESTSPSIIDREIRVGGPLSTHTPLAHADFFYWSSADVRANIATSLAALWRELHRAPAPPDQPPLARYWQSIHLAAHDTKATWAAERQLIQLVATSLRRGGSLV